MKYLDFISPMDGKIINIENVPDETFSSKAMGDGFAYIISGSKVVSPVNGEIVSVFPGGHAILIKSDENINLMIHIGLETHNSEGMHNPLVKQGDKVKQGDVLVETKLGKKLLLNKKSKYSPVVFLNGEKVKLLKENLEINAGDKEIVEIEY